MASSCESQWESVEELWESVEEVWEPESPSSDLTFGKRRQSLAELPVRANRSSRRISGTPPHRSGEPCMRIMLLDNSGCTGEGAQALLAEGVRALLSHGREAGAVENERWRTTWSMALAHAQWCGRHMGAAAARFVLLNPPCPEEPMEGRDFVTVRPSQDEEKVQRQVEALARLLQRNGPCGTTPLTGRLRQLRARLREELGEAPRLALCVVTDSLPTSAGATQSTGEDKRALLRELQAWADSFECSPVVRLATGQRSACKFYRRLRHEVPFRLGLVEDLRSEAKAAAAAGNGWLAYTPQLHWLRESGALEGSLGLLTQRALAFPEVVELLSWLLKQQLPGVCPKAFCIALQHALCAAAPVYNGRLQKMSSPVDLQRLRAALGLGPPARLVPRLKELARAAAVVGRSNSLLL